MSIFGTKYRIVYFNCNSGQTLEVEWRPWFWPFWLPTSGLYSTLEEAKEAVARYKNPVVWHD